MSCPVIRTPPRRLAHAAFEDIAHAKLAADLPHVDRPALVGEARIAGDHEPTSNARWRRSPRRRATSRGIPWCWPSTRKRQVPVLIDGDLALFDLDFDL